MTRQRTRDRNAPRMAMRQLLAVCLLLAIAGVQAEGQPTRAELPPDPAKCAACAFISHRNTIRAAERANS